MNSTPETITISLDGHELAVPVGSSVLQAAHLAGIEIPTLCYLEKCGPLNTCLVCLVKINGKLVPSCGTQVEPGMVIESETDEVHEARRTALELLFSDHVGDCLAPCNRLCPLALNIPQMLRQLQLGRVGEAIRTIRTALPLPSVLGRLCHHPCEQGCRRGAWDDPASIRDLERFAADEDLKQDSPWLPVCKSASGKSVAIIGAGPTGLAAAYFLTLQGHHCTVADRNNLAGGSLRKLSGSPQLPEGILDAELKLLERLKVQFRLKAELGKDVRLDGLLRGFDAVLIASGESSKTEGESWGLAMAPGGIKVTEGYMTSRHGVFAAGRVTRPLQHLVRAMAEGQAAAECIHRFLTTGSPELLPKPFSSVMGRLETSELRLFLKAANTCGSVTPCDGCAGLNRAEAGTEAARCLHCDCRSSGDCALQTYAQKYGVNASRFRRERKPFEQQLQPGGIIFEPGKCILCGICVKLTEMAKEPLGLTFIGRGFDVRLAAPFDQEIENGLQKVAEECVRHCPTGALVFR